MKSTDGAKPTATRRALSVFEISMALDMLMRIEARAERTIASPAATAEQRTAATATILRCAAGADALLDTAFAAMGA
jgi:hypothetical protein